MTDLQFGFVYVCGAVVTLIIAVWFVRKDIVKQPFDIEDGMPLVALAVAWPIAAFLGIFMGLGWVLSHGCRLLASAMIAIEKVGARRREHRELMEKAQREIFAEVDQILRESNEDEVRAFMSKLRTQ